MKQLRGDHRHRLLIAGDELRELQQHTGSMAEAFGLDRKIENGWQHEIVFEGNPKAEPGRKFPICLEGARACPPEDCGGVWDYADFVEAMQNPDHERHDELLEWIGGEFDPEPFDPVVATKAMQKGLPDWKNMV